MVEPNPIIDNPFCLESVGDFVQVDSFLFQVSGETFNEDVIEMPAPSVHYRQVIASNHQEARIFSHLFQSASKVHSEDGPSTRGEHGSDGLGGHVIAILVHVSEYWSYD